MVMTKLRKQKVMNTLGLSSTPANKIEHVIIIVKENHCFDNYFGTFPGANGTTMQHSPNPPLKDPDHRHGVWLTRKTTAVREQFTANDIPAYFAYAKQFTLCDNYFTDVAGPSTPNHLMLITADSPIIDNPPRYRLSVGAAPFKILTSASRKSKVMIYFFNFISMKSNIKMKSS